MKMNADTDIDQINPPKKGIGTRILDIIGILWTIHVLIAALLFPRCFLPSDSIRNLQNSRKEAAYSTFRFLFGTFILLFNIFCVIALFTRSSLIDAAKVLFVIGTWIAVGIIFILFNHLRDVYNFLLILEDDAIQSRDQSIMLIRAGQAALKAQNLKLYGDEQPFSFGDLLKKIGPLAILVLNKSNVKDVAFEALKLALSGTKLLKYFF